MIFDVTIIIVLALFFSNQAIFKLRSIHFLRHNAIAHLLEYSVNITFIRTGKSNHVTRFIAVFALFWFGPKPEISLRCACT